MPKHAPITIAAACGMCAFVWALLASEPLPPPERRPRTPAIIWQDPDAVLKWLADGWGDRDARVWREGAEILLWRGEVEAAREAFRKVVAIEGEERGWERPSYSLAWALARLADERAPQVAGHVLDRMGERDQARAESYELMVSRARLLLVLGQPEAAARDFQLARWRYEAAGEPARAEPLYWLARIEAGLGNHEAALAALEQAAQARGRVDRAGSALWAVEFNSLREDPRFRRAILAVDGESRLPG